MKLHANARLSVKGRQLLVERIVQAGWSLTEAARAAGVSDRTARKWLARHRQEGEAGLLLNFSDTDNYLVYSVKRKKGGLFAQLRIARKKPQTSFVADQVAVDAEHRGEIGLTGEGGAVADKARQAAFLDVAGH